MSLKKDLREAILSALSEAYPMHDIESFDDTATVILDHVWAALENELGATQERLMLQVSAARTELAAARRKIEVLTEMVQEATAKTEAEGEE